MSDPIGTLALLAEHVGIWEGEYSHIAPDDRAVQQRLRFRILVELPGEPRIAYRQTSHYWQEDGARQQLVYVGAMHGNRLVIDDGRIRGECFQIEPRTLYMRFAFATAPAEQVCEMIQLSRDGEHRARTWHWFRNERLWRVTLVRERRASRRPGDWPSYRGEPDLAALAAR